MPALITHHLFGREACRISGIEPAFPDVFSWGAQGPDIFFFALPIETKGVRLIKAGCAMHAGDIEKNFAYMAQRYREAQGDEKDALLSYLYGYLAHYVLDSTMHPFVYGMQRHFRSVLPKAPGNYLHRRIETNLDILFLSQLNGQTIRHYAMYTKLRITPELDYICRMYTDLVREHYDIRVPYTQIRRAFRDMKTAYSALYSPKGVKRGLIEAAEHLAGRRYPSIAALSHTIRPTHEIDFANSKKEIRESGNDALDHDAYELFALAAQRYAADAAILNRLLTVDGDFSQITHGVNFEGDIESKEKTGGK